MTHHEMAWRDVLLRTNAEDHPALRCVCRRFRSVLEADEFRRDRMITEYAQVEARLQTRDELINQSRQDCHDGYDSMDESDFLPLGQVHDGEPGLLTNRVRITVDGKEAGSAGVVFVRCGKPYFYELCDMYSLDLEVVGALFFNQKDIPTALSSVKENGVKSTEYFVYISTFFLQKEYRQHTWVGAQVLRDFLTRDTVRGKWSTCIYLADAKGQVMSQDDETALVELDQMNRDDRYRDVQADGASADQVDMKRREEQLKMTFDRLCQLDVRSFLRCGFQQAPEPAHKSKCIYVFCFPRFLERAMPSHTETITLPLTKLTSQAKEETSWDDKKLDDIIEHNDTRNGQSVTNDALLEEEAVNEILETFAQNSAVEVMQELNEQFDDAISTIDQLQRQLVEDGSPETEERRRELTFSRLNVERGRQDAIEETRNLCRQTVQNSFHQSEEFRSSVNQLSRSLAQQNKDRVETERR